MNNQGSPGFAPRLGSLYKTGLFCWNRLLISRLSCLIILFAPVQFVSADDSSELPDLKGTLDYLVEHINAIRPYKMSFAGDTSWIYRSARRVDGDSIEITQRIEPAHATRYYTKTRDVYTPKVAKLNPSNIKVFYRDDVQKYTIEIWASSRDDGISKHQYQTRGEGSEEDLGLADLTMMQIDGIADESEANRLKNALKHAIELAGGKPTPADPFDHQ